MDASATLAGRWRAGGDWLGGAGPSLIDGGMGLVLGSARQALLVKVPPVVAASSRRDARSNASGPPWSGPTRLRWPPQCLTAALGPPGR